MANNSDPKDIKVDVPQGNDDHPVIDDPAVKQPDDPKDLSANQHAPELQGGDEPQKNYSSVHQGEHVQAPSSDSVTGGQSELDRSFAL